MFLDKRSQKYKDVIFTMFIHTFNLIPVEIPKELFFKLNKVILNFIRKTEHLVKL